MSKKQNGNILFLILLAVVLFAALSYAVTSSLRGGGQDASKEKAESQAADLLNYFTQLDTAVQRMMVTGNVQDYQLNFYYQSQNVGVYGTYDNTNCTESRCRVFDPAGGGVAPRTFVSLLRTPTSGDGLGRILYSPVPGIGTSKPDILYLIEGVNLAVCRAINAKIGVPDILYNVNSAQGGASLMYQYTIPVGPIPDVTLATTGIAPEIASNMTFCSCQDATESTCVSNNYRPKITHVLVAR